MEHGANALAKAPEDLLLPGWNGETAMKAPAWLEGKRLAPGLRVIKTGMAVTLCLFPLLHSAIWAAIHQRHCCRGHDGKIH